jgi:hypothetical protein
MATCLDRSIAVSGRGKAFVFADRDHGFGKAAEDGPLHTKQARREAAA